MAAVLEPKIVARLASTTASAATGEQASPPSSDGDRAWDIEAQLKLFARVAMSAGEAVIAPNAVCPARTWSISDSTWNRVRQSTGFS